MVRVTTNGTLLGYKSNLMRSSNNLNQARNKVLTQRNFLSYAEDPAAATQSFQLRRSYSRTIDQLGNVRSLASRFDAAYTAVDAVKSKLAEGMGKVSAVEGNSDSIGAGRQPLGEVLSAAAKSIVQNMNTPYGENFIFAGKDGLKVPFSWGKNGELLYRGIDVNSGSATGLPSGSPPDPTSVTAGTPWGDYYVANPDFAKLVTMSKEKVYVDIGSGMTEDKNTGEVLESSAFDSSLPGIDILGFGVDKDGDPKNIAAIMMKLSDLYTRCDPESGEFENDGEAEIAKRLGDKLNDALASVTNKWTDLSSQAKYLDVSETRLTDMKNTLNEQILNIEQCDLGEAITDFSWAQYCYNAALKVGNSILSQSLIDYMG